MKHLKSLATFVVCLGALYLNEGFAQAASYVQDINGRPLLTKEYVDVEGSPYLSEDWAKGNAQTASGTFHKDLDLKYDQVKDELIFKGKKGETLAFETPVKAFTISGRKFGNGYPAIQQNTEKSYYEVIAEGKAHLLKRATKVVVEDRAYGSASITKLIKENVLLYVFKSGQLTQVKKDKKSILAALSDKGAELEAFSKTEKIDFKDEAHLARLIQHYNSL